MQTEPFQFLRTQRLLTGADFKRVFRGSKRSKDQFFLVCARYADQEQPRLGLAISKRFARLAVQRNRLKRQTREVFRLAQYNLAKADYVVVNQPAATHASASEITSSLQKHFERLSSQRPDQLTRKPPTKH